MGEDGGTFFEELAGKGYPPEVREEINWQAIARSHKVVISGGVSQGTHTLDKDRRSAPTGWCVWAWILARAQG